MEETRQNRIARLLQKELATIFQGQTRMMHGVLVSVTPGARKPRLEHLYRLSQHLPLREIGRTDREHQHQREANPLRTGTTRAQPAPHHPRATLLSRRLPRLHRPH